MDLIVSVPEFTYFLYSTYSKRQAIANSVDPDQTPQNAASDQVYTVLPLI